MSSNALKILLDFLVLLYKIFRCEKQVDYYDQHFGLCEVNYGPYHISIIHKDINQSSDHCIAFSYVHLTQEIGIK